MHVQAYCVAPRIADLPRVAEAVQAAAPGATTLVAHGAHADVEDRLLRFSRCAAPREPSPPRPERARARACIVSYLNV